MLQEINDKVRSRLGGLKLDPRIGLGVMAAAAALLAVGIVMYLWRDLGAMRPLYGAGEPYPAAEVMQVLDAEQIPYHLHPQSGQILVRETELGRARMLLSAKGVHVAVPVGYGLFDKDEPLGTSQFVQDIRLKRSLEGELARTIMALKGIDNARVHLALQESNSFVVSNRDPAKASVMVQMSSGYQLNPEQVGAIVNLVANSVPRLQVADVSVVDQYGVLLSRGLNASGGPVQSWQVVDDYQQKASANVEQVLAPILGMGNYRISVTADIDFSQKEETLQAFGDSPRLRSEVLQDESVLDRLAIGVPGSLSNRPVPPAGGQAPAKGSEAQTADKGATSVRKESTRKLDYDQSVTHVKHSAFNLRSQSIAVVLNASDAEEGGWPPSARAQLEAMLKSAVGFNPERGDVLTLSVFPFAPTDLTRTEPDWWQNDQFYDLVKLGVVALVSLLLLLLVVRPALGRLIKGVEGPATLEGGEQAALNLDNQPSSQALASSKDSTFGHTLGAINPLSEIRLPAPGSGLELQVEHLQMLAQNDPERVSEVLKQWIGRNETSFPSHN
ncbi:flagellar basal-body MS-ring/collar protein FliF [Pseudomonas sp. PB3P13]